MRSSEHAQIENKMATIATRRFLIAGQCLLRRPYSTAEGLPLTFASPRQVYGLSSLPSPLSITLLICIFFLCIFLISSPLYIWLYPLHVSYPKLSLYFKAFYHNVNVRQVDVSSTNGSFGILPSHVPAIAVLKPGLVNVYENESTTAKFFGRWGSLIIYWWVWFVLISEQWFCDY